MKAGRPCITFPITCTWLRNSRSVWVRNLDSAISVTLSPWGSRSFLFWAGVSEVLHYLPETQRGFGTLKAPEGCTCDWRRGGACPAHHILKGKPSRWWWTAILNVNSQSSMDNFSIQYHGRDINWRGKKKKHLAEIPTHLWTHMRHLWGFSEVIGKC